MPSLHGYWGRLRAASKMSVGTTGFAVETKLISLSFFFFLVQNIVLELQTGPNNVI